MRRLALSCFGLVACHATPSTPPAPATAPASQELVAHQPDGTVVRVTLAGERIASIAPAGVAASKWIWPAVIDSHVHLTYWPVADELARAGVEGAVDLAAPIESLAGVAHQPIQLIAAGPMLTRDGGYPLDAWGADGYGLGCRDDRAVAAAVDRLAAAGARVVKLALDDDGLAPALIPAAVAAAHAHHMKVAAHALSDASALAAGLAGVDVLAHTPVEPLSDATIAAWRGKVVVSTLAAFGGSATAARNLARLRAGGATVLYGTDLGNSRDAGVSTDEIAQLARAGLDGPAIAAAMTTAPAAFWGFDLAVAAGHDATFLVLDRDPREDPTTLAHPAAVYVHGRARVAP